MLYFILLQSSSSKVCILLCYFLSCDNNIFHFFMSINWLLEKLFNLYILCFFVHMYVYVYILLKFVNWFSYKSYVWIILLNHWKNYTRPTVVNFSLYFSFSFFFSFCIFYNTLITAELQDLHLNSIVLLFVYFFLQFSAHNCLLLYHDIIASKQ